MDRATATILSVLVGGLIGAVARPAVVCGFWLRSAEPDLRIMLLFVSAEIGFVVGVLAVLIGLAARRTWVSVLVGAISGAGLAYGAAILTFLPLFWSSLLGIGGLDSVDENALLYGVAVAVTGAVSGGVGSLLRCQISGSTRHGVKSAG